MGHRNERPFVRFTAEDDRLRVHEHNGLVLVCVVSPDKKPPFPIFDTYDVAGYQMVLREVTRMSLLSQ